MRVLARGQVIKAGTDKVPNAPGYCLTHLFSEIHSQSGPAGCVRGV